MGSLFLFLLNRIIVAMPVIMARMSNDIIIYSIIGAPKVYCFFDVINVLKRFLYIFIH